MNRLYIIRYGTEIRLFLNDCFIDQNDESFAIIKEPVSHEIEKYLIKYKVKPFYVDKFPGIESKLFFWFNSCRFSRNKWKGIKNYKHYSSVDNRLTTKDLIKGNILIYNLFRFLFSIYLRYFFNGKLKSIKIDQSFDVYFGGYSSPELIALAAYTKRKNCRNIVVVNSWKDFYVNNYLPTVFDQVWVWNRKMKVAYMKSNPFYPEKNILIKGNPRFNALYKHMPSKDFNFYKKKYQLTSDQFILYTAINPRVYETEPEILINLLKNNSALGKYHLLIKTNPMDNYPERWIKVANQFQNVTILFSDWTWNQANEINVPSLDAEIEWFDLLKHCMATCNVASTVTMESLIAAKPVINILFNERNEECDIFYENTYSDFYSHVLCRQDVILTKTFEAFENALEIIPTIKAGENLDDLIFINA